MLSSLFTEVFFIMENQQLLEKLYKRSRVNTVLLVVILVLLVALLCFAVYGMVSINAAIAQFNTEYNNLKAVLGSFDFESIVAMFNELGSIDFQKLSETAEALDPELMNSALTQLGAIDIEALNGAIETLNKLAGTFGKFFG